MKNFKLFSLCALSFIVFGSGVSGYSLERSLWTLDGEAAVNSFDCNIEFFDASGDVEDSVAIEEPEIIVEDSVIVEEPEISVEDSVISTEPEYVFGDSLSVTSTPTGGGLPPGTHKLKYSNYRIYTAINNLVETQKYSSRIYFGAGVASKKYLTPMILNIGLNNGNSEAAYLMVGDPRDTEEAPTVSIGQSSDIQNGWMGTPTEFGLNLGTNGLNAMYIDVDQNVFIGTKHTIGTEAKTGYNLFVDKGVLSVDYAVATVATWGDYVFDESYELTSLEELEQFVEQNNHLPKIPTAVEIKEDGYSLIEMNEHFIVKIEELTLHTIDLNNKIKILEKHLERQENLINQLLECD